MGEIPEQPRSDGQVMRVAQNKLAPGNDALFNQIFHGGAVQADHYPLLSTGQIEAMRVPEGWVKRDNANIRAGAGLTEFHPVGHDDIRLNSFFRGTRISEKAARAFKDCLAKSPHNLTPEELKGLSQVVRDKSYDFKVRSAKTENLNGKRILSVEGQYKDGGHTGSHTLYVDSDGTGSAVQEISYTASGQDYNFNMDKAQQAFKSIIWK
jgi:hypothetical protein